MTESLANLLIFILERKEVVFAVTVGVCLSAGTALILIWYRTLREQKWVLFFATVFLLFSLQYSAHWCFEWFDTNQRLGKLITIILSTFNNTLQLLTAAALHRHFQRPKRRHVFIILASTAVVASLSCWGFITDSLWATRFPDMILSTVTLVLVGEALFASIPLGAYRYLLRSQARATALLYAALQIFHGFAPWVAKHWTDLALAMAELKITLDPGTLVANVAKLDEKIAELVIALDLLAFSLTLPLKLSFFLLALYIVSRSLEQMHPRAILQIAQRRSSKRQITQGRFAHYPYGSVNDLVESYAVMFEADVCELCLRLPGQKVQETLWRSFVAGRRRQTEVLELPSSNESIVGLVLMTGQSKWGGVDRTDAVYWKKYDNQKAFLTVPINHHGAVIGALNLEWRSHMRLTQTLAWQVEQIANQFSLLLEKERELASIQRLSTRLAQAEITEFGQLSIESIVTNRLAIADDLLAAKHMRISFKLGFEAFEAETPRDNRPELEQLKELSAPLAVSQPAPGHPARWTSNLGTLSIWVPHRDTKVDDPSRPMLGTSKFHRRLVAAVVTDAILDGCRRMLAANLTHLSQALADPNIQTQEQWLETLTCCLKEVGVCWVAADPDSRGVLLGPKDVTDDLLKQLNRQVAMVRGEHARVYALRLAGASSIIRLELSAIEKGWLWMGVPRPDFGAELDYQLSPWKGFLDHFTEIAGAALLRTQARYEIERLNRDVIARQGMVRASTILHEVKKHMFRLASSHNDLVEALDEGTVTADTKLEKLIRQLYRDTKSISQVVAPLQRTKAYDEQRPARLQDAFEATERLYRGRLGEQRSSLLLALPEDLPQIDMPLHVLSLALSELISNALDAQPHNCRVQVTAKVDGYQVICSVADNGPGIPDTLDVFLPHQSTKLSTGLGLWQVQQALNNEGGDIVLLRRRPSAEFELILPSFNSQGARDGH